MTRDYAAFLPPDMRTGRSDRLHSTREKLGWQPFFAQQISVEELTETPPVRVVEVHRNALHVHRDGLDMILPPNPEATVSHWLLHYTSVTVWSVVRSFPRH